MENNIKIKEQDLVLKVGSNIDTKKWDESKYYKFVSELTGTREYQKEAIFTALRFMCGDEYSNTKNLAYENFFNNEVLKEKYITYENFEKSLNFSEYYTASLDLATGTGKSWVMYGIANIMLAEKKVDQVLVLVPSVTIERELTEKFKDFATNDILNDLISSIPPKIINGSESIVNGCICIENREAIYKNSHSSITDSLIGKGNRTLVLSDESHHIHYTEENEWKKFITKIGFKYNIGLSGTCYYKDNSYFSDVIYRYSLKKAIEDNRIKMIEYVSESNVAKKQEDQWKIIINSHEEIRSKISYLPLTLVVTANISSCNRTAMDFKTILKDKYKFNKDELSEKILVIHSRSSLEDIVKLKNVDQKNSKVEWIFSVSMLTEGWDVKRVFQIVPHEERAFNSKLLIAQVLGRGLRIPNDWNYQNYGNPKVIIFNHAKWANSVKKLVDEVLEIERKLSSTIIEESKNNFELINANYLSSKTVTKTKKEDTYNLFEKGYIVLPTDVESEKVDTDFIDVNTNKVRTWSTIISHKTYLKGDIAKIMWDRFEDIPDDNNENLSEKYQNEWPIEKLEKIIELSLRNSGNKEITEKLKQKFLSSMGVVFRRGSTAVDYQSIPDKFEKISTKNLRKDYVSGNSLNKEKVLFWTSESKKYLSLEEKEFFDEVIDTTNSYKNFEVKNVFDFKTPQSLVIADSTPEKDFIKKLVSNNNSDNVDKWIKSNSTGFYSIEYSWRKGEHPQRGSFNPDFFIVYKNRIIVIEIKGDEQINDPDVENIGKYKAAIEHFEIINRHLDLNKNDLRYKFTMLTPKNYEVFFDTLKGNIISGVDKFMSELDVSIFEKIN
ncbi:MAG: DEAD/DEAH box helicase family protein [Bacilli bacterium]|nr:DEAD/DEAH box helicase family protein [Bacilli bacterium]MDD4718858.1 DEAD/DEAH box helicase family protein [Bacilli bacterium]